MLIGYEDDLGNLNFRNEDIRAKYKTEMGRFMRMDLSPVVERANWGLDSMRKAAMGQVGLDYALRKTDKTAKFAEFLQSLLTYGQACIGHWKYAAPDGKLEHELEIIPPWEMMPSPACPASLSQVKMMHRFRKVPLEWIKKKEGLKLPSSDAKTKLQIEKVPYGHQPSIETLSSSGYGAVVPADGTNESENVDDAVKGGSAGGAPSEEYVPLQETWVLGPDNTVTEYVVIVGRHKALHEKYDEYTVPFPVGTARAIVDGGFYTYGFVAMLMSGNHQQEKMLQNLYRNVEELDQYGTVLWPTTAGANSSEFTRKNGRPKIVTYEPDYSVPEAKPDVLQPSNTGDFPGRVAYMAGEGQDKLANQGPLFSGQNVGRMDSGSGIGFTFEVSQIAQTAVAHQIGDAWVQVYKSILSTMKHNLPPQAVLYITNIDDNIAGVTIGAGGEVSLDDNPFPDYWEVKLDIKDRMPKSVEHRKQELYMALQQGLVDPIEFRLINYREGLDIPVGNRQEFEAFRKAVYHNIILFNDGQTPNEILPNLIMDNPMIHLRAVTAFTNRLEFSFASTAVKNAFAQLTKTLQGALGNFPPQAPDMLQAAEMGMGGPQGGGPPPGAGPPGAGPPGGLPGPMG